MTLCFFVLSPLGAQASSYKQIKSYHEWKNEKVQAVLNQTIAMRSFLQKAKANDLNRKNNEKNLAALEKQLEQLQWNLDVANDLSVTDYFVLYLSRQTQAERFQQAATKLSTNEIAELMQAYADALGSESGSNAAQVSPGKLPTQATQIRDQIK